MGGKAKHDHDEKRRKQKEEWGRKTEIWRRGQQKQEETW